MSPQLQTCIMEAMADLAAETADSIRASLSAAARYEEPYWHFYADDLLPWALVETLTALPIEAPDPSCFFGKREDQNATRFYVNAATMRRFPILARLAEALQSKRVVGEIAALCRAPLEGTRLRLEYAVDCDGFWLKANGRRILEQIFTTRRLHKRAPFRRNGALMFVPGGTTWHGFEKRPIAGLRRSLILNYVGPQWRERGQLAFPNRPVAIGAQFSGDGAAPAPR
jgi:hypothetical protein